MLLTWGYSQHVVSDDLSFYGINDPTWRTACAGVSGRSPKRLSERLEAVQKNWGPQQ